MLHGSPVELGCHPIEEYERSELTLWPFRLEVVNALRRVTEERKPSARVLEDRLNELSSHPDKVLDLVNDDVAEPLNLLAHVIRVLDQPAGSVDPRVEVHS